MDILQEIIRSMNKEEIRHYKLYAKRYEATTERLDISLFDLYKKANADLNEDAIFIKLYREKTDKNTYYRLKNRLQEDLCSTIVLLHFDKDITNNLLRLIAVYNVFYQKNNFALAGYFLKRAEKKATDSENFELLDLIYANFVKLSNELIEINPENYIQKRYENAIKLNKIREMDQVLAALNYRIKVSQNFLGRDNTLLKVLDKTVKEFSNDISITHNRSFQIKIYRAISQALIARHNYIELEKFILSTFQNFQQNKWFDKSSHDIKLQMLVYLINALLKEGKFELALENTNHLGEEIAAFDKIYYDKYLFFYYNSLMAYYAQTDVPRALKVLDDFDKLVKRKKNTFYEQFIYLNRATLYFDLKKYNDAIRNLMRLYVNESFKNADDTFKLKIEIAETIIQLESGDKKTASKRVEQVRKKYSKLLSENNFSRDKKVLSFVEQLSKKEALSKSDIANINTFIKAKSSLENEDSDVLKYSVWLSTKVKIN